MQEKPLNRHVPFKNRADPDAGPPPSASNPPSSPEPQLDPLAVEEKLRECNLIYQEPVQRLLADLHMCRSEKIRDSILRRLQWRIDHYDLESMRKPDPFRPYGPQCLLQQGNLHFLTQMDGVAWRIFVDKLLTGVLIVGPQQAGKSRLIVSLCEQIVRLDPSIVITLLDPKDGFRFYTPRFQAQYLDLSSVSLDLCPPAGIPYEDFVFEFMPILADSLGLIYGIDILNGAAEIALAQRQEYAKKTGAETELCLQDIYTAIPLVKGTAGGRRAGYRDAAATALSRVLGHRGLFRCRAGLPLPWLFSQNAVLNTRSLTDDMQCRVLATYFLYWKYQSCRFQPEINQLRHLILIDDGSRFVGTAGNQFESASRTSPLAHILATLRSTGTGLCAASQLPALLDPSVLALTRTLVQVGSMVGQDHLKVIKNIMSLNNDQTEALTRLATREAVGLAAGSAYPRIIHGWVPPVPDPNTDVEIAPVEVYIEPWRNLADIPAPLQSQTTAKASPDLSSPTPTAISAAQLPVVSDLSAGAVKLVLEVLAFPYATINKHIERLGGSSRALEEGKAEACQKGYLFESKAGRIKYLIPTEKSVKIFQMPCPFQVTKGEHGFYTGLAAFLLKKDPRLATVKTEVALGRTNAASDVVTTTKSGIMFAYEVTLTATHLMGNASKYVHSVAYAKIVWLCRDDEMVQAVKGFFRTSDLPADLLARFEYLHFSGLVKQQRQMFN